jgi:Flp pilus assembly protein TadD
MKGQRLLGLHQKVWTLKNAGYVREATDALVELLGLQPDWEHGGGWYDLATWYEDLGEIEKARHSYQEALKCSPRDSNYLGGYASFEHLHGDPRHAVELHLRLLDVERRAKDVIGCKETIQGLRAAAARAGLTDEEVDQMIARPADEPQ